MANPVGSWQTTIAAREVYKFLGEDEKLIWSYRNGGHAHTLKDLEKLVNVMRHFKYGDCYASSTGEVFFTIDINDKRMELT